MSKTIKTNRVARLKRGLASTILLTSLVAQASPLLQVSAETLDYEYTEETPYKTKDTAQYTVNINPMIGQTGTFKPQGGVYSVQRIAKYTSTGERIEVEEPAQNVTLTPDEVNKINLIGDGEYKITPVKRIPGFLKDLGATHKEDALEGPQDLDEPAGHYIYAFPLISNGIPSKDQNVNFQPKLREARQTLEIQKLGDDTETPLAGVTFTLYQTHDTKLNKSYADGAHKIASVTTGADGKVEFEKLIEGSYYFVEEGEVPNRYLPDNRHIEFDVRVASDEETVSIVAKDNSDVTTVGNNVRGHQTGNTITRVNYVDPAQNKELTYQSVKGSDFWGSYENSTKGQITGQGEGIVYVNTNGTVEFASSVDIPRNFNDFEEFSIVDTIDNKLTILPETIELRVLSNETGSEGTYKLSDIADLVHDGQTITLNAKGSAIKDKLEADGVHSILLTYKATVDTNDIVEGVEFEELTSTQAITADKALTDDGNTSVTTTHTTNIRVREGRVVIDKETNDGENTPLEDADFQLYEPTDGAGELSYGGKNWNKAKNPRNRDNYFGTTNEDGQLIFENVPYGEYLIVETRAPEGYRLNNAHQVIEIKDDGDVVYQEGLGNTLTQRITNMRRNQIFPGTGTMGNIVILSVLAVAGGSLVYVTVKKRKEGEEEIEQA